MPKKQKLTDFSKQKKNANKHTERGLSLLNKSIRSNGWIGAMTAAADGEIFDGSARLETVTEALPADPIVVETDGKRPIIIKRTDIKKASDPKAVRLALEANRIAQVDLNWDVDILAEIQAKKKEIVDELFSEKELKDIGLEPEELEPAPEAQMDKADELLKKWKVKTGDLWQIGDHRLICGDCTDESVVARVMDGEKAGAVVTDSPYGINREGIENDDPEGLRDLFDRCLRVMPIANAVVINFQSPRLFPFWIDALRQAGHKFERALWFYDETDVTFPWRGWLMTSQIAIVSSFGNPKWGEDNYHHDCYLVKTAGKQEDSGGHSTAKPLDIVEELLLHTTGMVYEPFSGSGTTLVACERLHRKGRAIEIAPKYVAVALERLSQMGLTPKLIK